MATRNKRKGRISDAAMQMMYLSSVNPGSANLKVAWDDSHVVRSRTMHIQVVYRCPAKDFYSL